MVQLMEQRGRGQEGRAAVVATMVKEQPLSVRIGEFCDN